MRTPPHGYVLSGLCGAGNLLQQFGMILAEKGLDTISVKDQYSPFHSSGTRQVPIWRTALYMDSGDKSAPFGHATAP